MIRHHLALFLFLIPACREPGAGQADRGGAGPEWGSVEPGCEYDSVRPATGAPAEGLWVYQDPTTARRVAAMIGPARPSAERAQVSRRVETLESRPGPRPIRHVSESASVRLELIPPGARPAAVYPVGPLVLLASYEPCSPALREPLIRYLRRDPEGRVATDVLLRREAVP